jgi:hypothetical protein
MSKKVNKREVNLVLKDLNIQKMTSNQVQEEITKNQKLMNDFISRSKYPEAENCNEKIEALKKVLKQKKIKETNQRHNAEKENLKIDEYSDVNNLNFLWSKKFEELQSRSQAALDELKKNQELEYQKLFSQYQEDQSDVKPSSMFLKLQKEEEGLVKLRKFKEAEIIRKKKEAQRKLDMNKSGKNKENTFRCLEKKLKQKHTNELLYLQSKFQAEYDELNNEKQREMEFINKKYSAKNKDLVKQQKREYNINSNKNYGKRIANLHNDYEQKFVLGRKEYAPQQQAKKLDQIYAEVKDSKIEDIPLENNDNFDIGKKGNTIDPKNLNEDNGGNHLYEEENHDGEDIEYNQHQQSENMNDEGLESNGNEENEM